jgi:hypothetical protein
VGQFVIVERLPPGELEGGVFVIVGDADFARADLTGDTARCVGVGDHDAEAGWGGP